MPWEGYRPRSSGGPLPGRAAHRISELTFKTTTPRGSLNLCWLSDTQTFSVDTRALHGLNVGGRLTNAYY